MPDLLPILAAVALVSFGCWNQWRKAEKRAAEAEEKASALEGMYRGARAEADDAIAVAAKLTFELDHYRSEDMARVERLRLAERVRVH